MAEPAFSQEEMAAALQQLEAEESGSAPAQTAPFTPEEMQVAVAQLESEPAPRQDPLRALERMAATRAREEPDRLESFLKDRGFSTKRKGDEVLIDKEGKFVPWDPKGFDVGDLADLVPEALEFGVAAAAGTAKVAGALSAPVTGPGGLAAASAFSGTAGAVLEGAFQAAEKVGGVREEFDPGRIVAKGTAAATVPGAGKLAEKAGKVLIGKAAGKAAETVTKKVSDKLGKASETSGLLGVIRREATKRFGEKGAARVELATDIARMAAGDKTPIARRALLSVVEKVPEKKAKELTGRAVEKAARAGGKATGLSAAATTSEAMDKLLEKVVKESE